MKSILITGGSGKVGFQLVKHFLNKNFKVVTTTRNSKKFKDNFSQKLDESKMSNLLIIEVDFTHDNAIEIITKNLQENDVFLENIVHNARCLDYLKIEEDNTVSTENFSGEFYLDVIFPYHLNLEIINQQKGELKNIIFISSIYGVVAPTPTLYDDLHKSSPINYGVSKAAQIHLVKELAVRLGPEIRVNCVSFGGIKGRTNKEFLERYSSLNPLRKMLEEIDVVAPVDFLVSEGSSNMTGQNLIIDGGWTIW
ncbi:SDR family oxidoreductase [Winogradskyella sp. SM1960]|uniref:SDR family oxidoreductase n=1 Tax=Winogradskyella sp. SM1960 TaxID=2865955 RepID=UPI001CD4A3C1|nr:SDR family oxidoreductase [Winogradskyella sp. SM1960]